MKSLKVKAGTSVKEGEIWTKTVDIVSSDCKDAIHEAKELLQWLGEWIKGREVERFATKHFPTGSTIPTETEIEEQREVVRDCYEAEGMKGNYIKEFDKLAVMNRVYMSNQFRVENMLAPDAKTPYCDN